MTKQPESGSRPSITGFLLFLLLTLVTGTSLTWAIYARGPHHNIYVIAFCSYAAVIVAGIIRVRFNKGALVDIAVFGILGALLFQSSMTFATPQIYPPPNNWITLTGAAAITATWGLAFWGNAFRFTINNKAFSWLLVTGGYVIQAALVVTYLL